MLSIEIKDDGCLIGHIQLYPTGVGKNSAFSWEFYSVGPFHNEWINTGAVIAEEGKLLHGRTLMCKEPEDFKLPDPKLTIFSRIFEDIQKEITQK